MYIQTERAKEILKEYNAGKHDLFNWCEEYKSFISECVSCCVSMEWEYMLKKSYEDNDSPCSYEDLDLFDKDRAIENIICKFEELNTDEEKKDFLEMMADDLYHNLNSTEESTGRLKSYLGEQDKDSLKDVCDRMGIEENDGDVLEWWIVQDSLKYRLEQQGEIFLNGAWGRQTSGQSISLDWCCINAFINILKDRIN